VLPSCFLLAALNIYWFMGLRRRLGFGGWFVGVALPVLYALGFARPGFGYSVIMHQAIIDAEWEDQISPFLLRRFPQATPDELREAKSYAYGGSVIQDLGYYPFGSHFFSHLTHYVRSGDFVQALFEESRDIDDYAFALGALSHYSADIEGHSLGVNRAVPLLYPKLAGRYGHTMTWEDSPYAHLLTEFGFDTVEVVAGHVAPQKYHEWIGFRVREPLLQRAFRGTYGLELPHQTLGIRLSLDVYRECAGKIIPQMSMVAWALKRKSLEERATGVHHKSLFHLRRQSLDQVWEKTRAKPGPGDEMTAFVFRILPKVGPLQVFQFHVPTDEAEQLFANSLKATIADYDVKIADARLDPPDINLDTGRPTRPGEYRYCDRTFAQLLHRLAKAHFDTMTPALRDDLLRFYGDSTHDTVRRKPRQWRRVLREINELKGANAD
jgi:hypothetical protein